MANKCLKCGHIFDDCEIRILQQEAGEIWSGKIYEEVGCCPLCGGDFEETKPCEICGSEHLEEELNGGVCDECLDEYRKDFDFCYKLTGDEKWDVKINILLATLFEPADIEQILINHLKENNKEIDCSKFIDDDIYWFTEKLTKEVKKNENSKK